MAIDLETSAATAVETKQKPTKLCIKVIDHAKGDQPVVNVRLPLGVAKWGMKMAGGFSPEMKDLDIDWESLTAAVEGGARGELVHVEDQEKHQTVDVWVE
jgi:hypothetical protein